jgi:hypothetical protein
MVKKPSLILDDEFIQYCKLNDIEDIEKLAKEIFKKGFTMLKYGDRPGMVSNEIIPVIPLGPPNGLEIIVKENKEDKPKRTIHPSRKGGYIPEKKNKPVKQDEKTDIYGE